MAFIHTVRRRGPDPYYRWKVASFTVGAAFGLAGIFTGRDNLVLIAIPILAVGVGLRWLPRRGEPTDTSEDAGETLEEPEAAEHEDAGSAGSPPGVADAQRPPTAAEDR